MTKRVLIALTSHSDLGGTGRRTGFYVPEAAEPWAVFTDAGYEVDLVSVAGGRPPRDGEDPADPLQDRFLNDPRVAAQLAGTPAPGDVDSGRYDAVLFAGGHGTMWDFPDNKGLAALARDVYERGGIVAAVCHGPAALVGLTLSDGSYLVDGRRVAAFTNGEEEAVGLAGVVPFLLADRLAAQGARHLPAPNFAPHVVEDGRLVTGQNPASARGVAEAVVTALDAAWVAVPVADGTTMDLYAAGRPGAPGVIVAPELFGADDHLQEVTRRIARLGYRAVLPDFHHRTRPRAALPYGEEGRAQGFALLDHLTRDGVLADVAAAIGHLGGGRIGMVGFSAGGHLAVLAAARLDIAVAAAFYPGWLTNTGIPVSRPEPTITLADGIKGRLLIEVGEDDHAVPREDRELIARRLTAAGVKHEIAVHPGTPHGFFCDRRDTYRPEAAAAAWERVSALLSEL
ncbi:dienelactone hydrolase family protein [Actinomadura macrotermitis]|uniref:Molecular chaperone Hsp31 and glyoxalase 3 n=1 Tax=Actinomadura macrotermitis TaxID=2585200 RepID=A0A7K0BRH8_9ACTN|nr:dienelactone hydrolase family protein [Actinomadura macrotermitis]MQY03788.1 Molecular chaperone Hsp31 and glyoxalase 3 [Actinomadura macrotermitis]